VVALIAAPLTILASHSECAARHHGCARTAVADDCCCGHVAAIPSSQNTSSEKAALISPAAEPIALIGTDAPVHQCGQFTGDFGQQKLGVIDRLTLFRVLLI